jgi:hypothetical protein
MSSLPQSNTSSASPGPRLMFHERRREKRQIVLVKARLSVLDGPNTGLATEVQTRDLSLAGICFLLREELRVGQYCQIELPGQRLRRCEVIRSRLLSSGKYEIAVQYRD